MNPQGLPVRALVVFFALQALDIITTLLGLRAGAHEANILVAHLLHLGPMTGLLLAKSLGVVLAFAVFLRGRIRWIGIVNLWFAGVVTWNLVMLWAQHLRYG